jgi:hypothetical protein
MIGCSSAKGIWVMVWCHWSQMGEVAQVFESQGLKNISPGTWHKSGQNYAGGVGIRTSSCEWWMEGRKYINRNDLTTHFSKNPTERHNFYEGPPLRVFRKNADGEAINQHQKPPEPTMYAMAPFVAAGTNVLVCCAGAGGEVVAALKLGCNVVCVEKDQVQFDHLVDLMKGWDVGLETEEAKAERIAKRAAGKEKGKAAEEDEKEKPSCEVCGMFVEVAVLRKCPGCGVMVCTPQCFTEGEEKCVGCKDSK